MNTVKKNIYLFTGYFIVNSILYIMKLIALDIYFKLNDLSSASAQLDSASAQLDSASFHILFKISFKSLRQVFENIIIGKIIY